MSKPKQPGESAEAKAARLAEEERIRIAQARADAEEAAAGRQFLTRRTRAVMRLYGARRALAGLGAGSPTTTTISPLTGNSSGGFTLGGYTLGGGVGGGGGSRIDAVLV